MTQHLKAAHPYPVLHPPQPPRRVAAFSTSTTTDESITTSLQRLQLNSSGIIPTPDRNTKDNTDLRRENTPLGSRTLTLSKEEESVELEADTPPRIAALLQQAIQPTKRSLIAEINTIVRQVTRNKTLKGFRLQERGSLFSPLIEHISDADIQLFTRKGVVTQAQCEHILHFAQQNLYLGHVHSIRWECFDGSKMEVPFADFDFSTSLQNQPGYVAFVVTGVYRFAAGFLIPVDIALTCGGEKSEPQAHRCAKIMNKLEEGDFAKVLQKIRALFKKGAARDSLVGGVNRHVGRLRFIVKQLEMLQLILGTVETTALSTSEEKNTEEEVKATVSDYLHSTLGFYPDVLSLQHLLSSTSPSVLLDCQRELQRRALSVIQSHHKVIEAKLLQANRGQCIDEYLHVDDSKYVMKE